MMDERMFWFPLPSDPAMTELERQTSPMNADGMISTPTQVTPELPPESPGISALAESLSPTTTICSSDNANLLLHDKRVCTYKRRGAESCIECYATSVYFPVIMHRMISQMCTVDASLMHWCDEGKHFWISQRSCSLSDVLKVYFKRTNIVLDSSSGNSEISSGDCSHHSFRFSDDRYQSLRRQLNAYQFMKISAGPYVHL
jgi:hypothetical protein